MTVKKATLHEGSTLLPRSLLDASLSERSVLSQRSHHGRVRAISVFRPSAVRPHWVDDDGRAVSTTIDEHVHLHEDDDGEFAYLHASLSSAVKKVTEATGLAALRKKDLLRATGLVTLFLVTMSVQGLLPITVVWSKGGLATYPFMVGWWLVCMKLLVLALSVIMYLLARCSEGRAFYDEADPMTLGEKMKLGLWLLPPSCLYTFSDVLAFAIMARTDPATYTILRQVKIIFVAFLNRFALNRQVSLLQWVAVTQLLTSALLFKADMLVAMMSSSGDDAGSGHSTSIVAVLLILLKVTLDSVAVVWCDWAFKRKISKHSLSFPEQQIFFAIFTVIAAVIYFLITEHGALAAGRPLFDGFNSGAVLSLCMFASYGLCVSLFLKFLDSLLKLFMSLGGILVTLLASAYLFGTEVTVVQRFAAVFIIYSILTYKLGKVVKSKKGKGE